MRVLIVAENASKRMGGEAILPYHYFRTLRARRVDTFLVVHERCRAELEELFPSDRERLRFVPDRLLQKLLFSVGRMLPHRIEENTCALANQMLTQRAQRRIVRSLTTPGTVVHQPAPVSPRTPSLMWGFGAPVVCGPLNGGMEYPPAFRSAESAATRLAVRLGRRLSDAVNTLLPGKLRADVVLVANERTQQALPRGVRRKITKLPENGVDLTQWQSVEVVPADAMPRFVFIGRLVEWKALDVVIEALEQVPDAMLDVIGDGPCFAAWQRLAIRRGLADRIHFHGWMPQQECARYLSRSRALVLPSLYESGGAVVLEAMALARPVIATAWGGPTDYLDASSGFLIQPQSRAALVEGFAKAMQCLANSPELAARLGTAGRRRVLEQYDWERKTDAMISAYASVLPAVAVTA